MLIPLEQRGRLCKGHDLFQFHDVRESFSSQNTPKLFYKVHEPKQEA